MRWVLYFLLVPQLYLLAGFLHEAGAPLLDVGALLCVFLALFAEPRALPGLLLGAAVGRALVDEGSLPIQLLVLGVPIAALLPLRAIFDRQQLWWQIVVAVMLAIAVPRWSCLCGQWFGEPTGSALDTSVIAATGLVGPVVLFVLRKLPPLRAFRERVA